MSFRTTDNDCRGMDNDWYGMFSYANFTTVLVFPFLAPLFHAKAFTRP